MLSSRLIRYCRVRAAPATRESGLVQARGPRDDKRRECVAGAVLMTVAAVAAVAVVRHRFVRGETSRNLQELDDDEHGQPNELERGPKREADRKRIRVQDLTEFVADDVAGRIRRPLDILIVSDR